MRTPESQPRHQEQTEFEKVAIDTLPDRKEKGAEHLDDSESRKSLEHEARRDAEALFSKEAQAESNSPDKKPTAISPVITKQHRQASYEQTMDHIQEEMSAPARLFSKVIHNPFIEKTSDTIGNTIARPNAIFAGALTAIVLVGSVYLLARNTGYELSGSETIASFAIGWLIGIIFDFFKVMITGKR